MQMISVFAGVTKPTFLSTHHCAATDRLTAGGGIHLPGFTLDIIWGFVLLKRGPWNYKQHPNFLKRKIQIVAPAAFSRTSARGHLK